MRAGNWITSKYIGVIIPFLRVLHLAELNLLEIQPKDIQDIDNNGMEWMLTGTMPTKI